MDSDIERKKVFCIKVAYFAILLAIYYVVCRYVIYKIMPFFIAAIVMLILRRPTDVLAEKLRIPRKGVAGVMVLLFYGIIGVGVTFACIQLVMVVMDYLTRLPDIYARHFAPLVQQAFDWYELQLEDAKPEIQSYIVSLESEVMSKIYQLVSYISSKVISFAQSFVTAIPGAIIGVLFGIISTFFMAMDFPRIEYFLMGQLNDKARETVSSAFVFLRDGIGKMIVSYLCIMLITFTELNIGLHLIGVKGAAGIAAIIAVFDILPVLGTGGIVLPWAIISFIKGDIELGIKLLILYVVVTVIRNILEPKIVGASIGLHPVVMLMSIFLGATILGPLGIIILPFTLIIIKKLNDNGSISLFKSVYLPKEEKKKGSKENSNE